MSEDKNNGSDDGFEDESVVVSMNKDTFHSVIANLPASTRLDFQVNSEPVSDDFQGVISGNDWFVMKKVEGRRTTYVVNAVDFSDLEAESDVLQED